MKVALVTTTINVPTVLALYAKYGPDVMMFIAGDRKTDDIAVTNFLLDACPNCAYYGIDTQHSMYPKLSALIGENCIQRRNIATLEALKWGADAIVSIDDDNIPLAKDYFRNFEVVNNDAHPCWSWHGLKATSPSGWFDVGQILQPKAEHRGFPHTKRAEPVFSPIVDARIGVAAGICMGDPDIGAVERIANGPIVHGVSEILRSGVVTDPAETWTVFNSQNTAFIRELAPAMFMLPGIGRYDDIYASLICQRVMREMNLHVHFGKPFVWQQRNKHDLVKDLTMELLGMQNIVHFSDWLDGWLYSTYARVGEKPSCLAIVSKLFNDFGTHLLPQYTFEAALAWCDACEQVI